MHWYINKYSRPPCALSSFKNCRCLINISSCTASCCRLIGIVAVNPGSQLCSLVGKVWLVASQWRLEREGPGVVSAATGDKHPGPDYLQSLSCFTGLTSMDKTTFWKCGMFGKIVFYLGKITGILLSKKILIFTRPPTSAYGRIYSHANVCLLWLSRSGIIFPDFSSLILNNLPVYIRNLNTITNSFARI